MSDALSVGGDERSTRSARFRARPAKGSERRLRRWPAASLKPDCGGRPRGTPRPSALCATMQAIRLVIGRGTEDVAALLTAIGGPADLPGPARKLCAELGGDVATLEARIARFLKVGGSAQKQLDGAGPGYHPRCRAGQGADIGHQRRPTRFTSGQASERPNCKRLCRARPRRLDRRCD